MVSGALGHSKKGRLISIQLLRFVSALWVVALHQALAFADYIGAGLGAGLDAGLGTGLGTGLVGGRDVGNHIGNIAVCGFFIISGYIMVHTSHGLFGQPGARRIFWTRRAVRVFPPYWIATLLLVAIVMVLRDGRYAGEDIARSLLLWPYWSGAPFTPALPLLWVGWTLFYEMVFYFLFGLFVACRRWLATGLTVLALVLLVLGGQLLDPQSAPLWIATRPVVLVFIAGMALALWREQGRSVPMAVRLLALALAILIPLVMQRPEDYGPTSAGYLQWAALPAILCALALLGADIAWPRPALIDRLGDISFALYLLHVPAAHFWTFVWQSLHPPGGAWGFLVTLLIGTVLASWLFFTLVERPMTRWLNARLGAGKP